MYLEKFLAQWEDAAVHNNPDEPNEIHIAGDMNLDALAEKWMRSDYPLVTLARMVSNSCNLGNFTQLVTRPTRFQHNSVQNRTVFSLIDHIYTNCKDRCSAISVIPFGG